MVQVCIKRVHAQEIELYRVVDVDVSLLVPTDEDMSSAISMEHVLLALLSAS
jgi:hypothetical protein